MDRADQHPCLGSSAKFPVKTPGHQEYGIEEKGYIGPEIRPEKESVKVGGLVLLSLVLNLLRLLVLGLLALGFHVLSHK